MTMDRTTPARAFVLSALLVVTACASGDDAFMRQAREECASRGLDPAGKAVAACVEKRSNELYAYWGRVSNRPVE